MLRKGKTMNLLSRVFGNDLSHPRIYVPTLLVICLLILPLATENSYYHDVLVMMFFYAALAGSWNILGGFAGQISLGHTAFFGIGAYTSTLLYLNLNLSPWIGMFVGGGGALLAGLIIGIPCFRLKSHFFALATIAIASVMHILAVYFRGFTLGSAGLLIPFEEGYSQFMFKGKLPYVYISLVYLFIVLLVSFSIKRSKIGYYLMSLRENPDAAESLGIDILKYKLIAMSISVFFVAIGGTFYAQYLMFIDPETVFSFSVSIDMALFSIIGGLGTSLGPVIGAFVLTPIDVLLRGWLGPQYAGLNLLIYGVILIFTVTYFPKGIIELVYRKYNSVVDRLPGGVRRSSLVRDGAKQLKRFDTQAVTHSFPENRQILFSVDGLTRFFGGLAAVNCVSFDIKEGEVLGLLGPNGAGKTTIFNLISGFLKPDAGIVKFKGRDITGLRPPNKSCALRIGRTFQVVKPFQNMTILENIMVGAYSNYRDSKTAKNKAIAVMEFVGLTKYRDYLASSLTIADRKRLELARALATEPEFLLLDEVMAGLTPVETAEIIKLVKKISQKGIALLIIEHVMQAIMSLSDRIVVINYGEKIAEGVPIEIAKNKKVIEAYLGEEYVA